MSADPNDPMIPILRIALESRSPGQTVMPIGNLGILAGDSCEVVAEPHTIRIETFVVTDAMRDADRVRFAELAALGEENRALTAQVATLTEDVRRLSAALEITGQLAELHTEPTKATFLGDPMELPPEDPFRFLSGAEVDEADPMIEDVRTDLE